MPCKLCVERGKPWSGDDPRCAFERETFSPDNWNCATMNALRNIAEAQGHTHRDDMGPCSIGFVPFEGDDAGYIVMTWYKNRGRTGNAVVMRDSEIRTFTYQDARDALAHNARVMEEAR
ncbi:hypothetical protein I532_04215 [Brevibacillus borstelensis AK1]|uniref:Uncharacterized protein n=1 Tax=Brevibacillus borstelensis AK1 TaxID=1300222 RepID=M8E692_9BACL|nr:hypothetical protein [Brevibacillus borstelensis]EMT54781.1 hypothetical protein I532_04215 [Brevibacillus borstelensis AK1]